MRAIVCPRYGPPEVLALADIPSPEPKPDELLLKVKAVEVTKADCEFRSFRFPVKWFWLPLRLALGVRRPRRPVLGSYFAAEVVSAPSEHPRLQAGDSVFGCCQLRLGAYAEYLTLPGNYTVLPMPSGLSFAEAASIPLGGLNALHFLNLAQLRPGETILINGAGGSIGLHAIQIAKAWGAAVTAVDKASKRELVLEAGADHFIDYQVDRFARRAERYDVLFDMVPTSSFADCLSVLQPEGRYLKGNVRLLDMARCLWTNRFTRRRAHFAFAAERLEELQVLASMAESQQIRPILDCVLPLEQAPEAHRRVESESRNGAVVLAVS